MTSSKVLAIRDSATKIPEPEKGFKEFFEMFALNVANNCDQEAQSDAQQKMRYEKCEIMYGEADYFQKNILLTQFFSKNTRNGIAEVVILDEWDNMTIDNACKTLCMSYYIIYMRNLKDIFIRI